MSITDEEFFAENIVKVNKRVGFVLFGTAVVPVLFVVLTLLGIWSVPFSYAVKLFIYTVSSAVICYFLNKYPKTQFLDMYVGIIAASGYVFFLGYKGVIATTVSYAFGPFLSCLYYNRRLTHITTICNFLLVITAFWLRSYGVEIVNAGVKDHLEWFIQNSIGIIIEFTFVFIISDAIARRTSTTFRHLMASMDERDRAFDKLKERNDYIISLNSELENKNRELADTQYKIIQFVAEVLGSHDLFTGRHVIHTQKYVEIICKQLKNMGYHTDELTDKNIYLFKTAAFLHDIGKIHIPEGILNKIGKFTPDEFDMMKAHPIEGKKLLEYLPKIDNGDFNEIAKQMALCHHEKWDGSGYPNALKGEDIPFCARIMAAADVLDALVSQRLYKEPMSVEEAMDVFEKSRGLHFETCIADAVISLKPLITLIDNDFKTTEASTNAEELEWWQRYHSTTH